MPWVEVISAGNGHPLELDRLSKRLDVIVAEALHAEGDRRAHLVPDDVGIEFRVAGPRSKCESLNIIIHANNYPRRLKNIQERARKIADEVSAIVNSGDGDEIHGIIYIPTMKGFAEF